MSLLATHQNNVTRKRAELAKISQDRAKESTKLSTQQQKITSAKRTLSSTKSSSTIKSKLNEITKAENEMATINKKIANYDTKIARKNKEIADEEKKYRQEEQKELKKISNLEKKRFEESKREIHKIGQTLSKHSKQQGEIQKSIEELQRLPDTIKVLFLASNPSGSAPLKLDEEARSIQEMIRKSEYRNSVKFTTRWAVRASDLLQAINEENPDIIHFSGHGTDQEELVLQNTDGSPKFVGKEAIVQTISTVSDKVRLVFFNTCFSYEQANSIISCVDAAIGMSASISDEAARIFAAQFYSSIGFGKSLHVAFLQAKSALMLESIAEEDTPLIYAKDGLDLGSIYFVKPDMIRSQEIVELVDENMSNASYQNNFTGNISNIQIQQNVQNSHQTQIVSRPMEYNDIVNVIQQLQLEIQSLGLSLEQQDRFVEMLNSVQSDAEKATDKATLKQGLSTLKEFLMKTSTTLAASGAISLITNLLNGFN